MNSSRGKLLPRRYTRTKQSGRARGTGSGNNRRVPGSRWTVGTTDNGAHLSFVRNGHADARAQSASRELQNQVAYDTSFRTESSNYNVQDGVLMIKFVKSATGDDPTGTIRFVQAKLVQITAQDKAEPNVRK